MIFKINYDGKYEDSFVIEGSTVEEIREKVFEETAKRCWDNDDCWSELVEE